MRNGSGKNRVEIERLRRKVALKRRGGWGRKKSRIEDWIRRRGREFGPSVRR